MKLHGKKKATIGWPHGRGALLNVLVRQACKIATVHLHQLCSQATRRRVQERNREAPRQLGLKSDARYIIKSQAKFKGLAQTHKYKTAR